MAVKNTQATRLNVKKLDKAITGIIALGQFKDYSPQRKEFDGTKIAGLTKAQKETSEAKIAAQNALSKARDTAAKAEWDVYNFMKGASEQVMGQYGSDSNEYASIGYKKKSEYKKTTPGKKNAKKNAETTKPA